MKHGSIRWLLIGALTSCGGDDDDDGSSGSTTSDASSSEDASSSADASSTDTGSNDGSSSGESGGEPIACGDALSCDAAEVCVEEPNEPMCDALPRGETCPRGTRETQCGGAGLPCCCGPTPPPDYRCAPTDGCAVPTCECLATLCGPGEECSALAEPRTFRCEPPPAP